MAAGCAARSGRRGFWSLCRCIDIGVSPARLVGPRELLGRYGGGSDLHPAGVHLASGDRRCRLQYSGTVAIASGVDSSGDTLLIEEIGNKGGRVTGVRILLAGF